MYHNDFFSLSKSCSSKVGDIAADGKWIIAPLNRHGKLNYVSAAQVTIKFMECH